MMNFQKVTLPLILGLSFLFVACQQSTQTPDNQGVESQIQDKIEDAGNALEDVGEDAGNALEDARNATEEGLEDAGDAVKEGIKDAGSAIEEAGDSIKNATN